MLLFGDMNMLYTLGMALWVSAACCCVYVLQAEYVM